MVRMDSLLLTLALPIGLLVSTGACISDTNCGICDPDQLVLESLTARNYANRRIHLLAPGRDRGLYFIDEIGACIESSEATNPDLAIRGAQEWCKISPLVSVDGLEFVFNNLLDPTTVELIRKQPSNPNLFEVYDWKTKIAHLEGPITRFNGDYRATSGDTADLVTRSVNLGCVDNLRAQGIDFDAEALTAGACDGFRVDAEGRRWPLEMQVEGRVDSYRGETDWRVAGCSAPDSGPDTCCNVCDYELAVNVAKYGRVGEGGARRSPSEAISCDPTGNVYEDCAEFVTDVDRSFEISRFAYEWFGQVETWRLPLYDKIRETHPDLRPPGAEPEGLRCQTDADCDHALGGDSGSVCIGETPEGVACTPETPDCGEGHCKAEWFVGCKPADGLGLAGACVDRRFKDKGAGACFIASEDFQACDPVTQSCATIERGNRLARADVGEYPDGILSASEACQASLGSPDGLCDPLFQLQVVPVPRFDRDQSLPADYRDCHCGDPSQQSQQCADLVEKFCTAPWGKLERSEGESNEGAYLTRHVIKVGGVVYDPALKGVQWRPGDVGNQPRSLVESCAENAISPDLIGGRSVQDGWRMHDGSSIDRRDFFELYENFDRGMCSGSTYTVVFSSEGEQVRDKVGNHLDELRYGFETPEFHVIPGSGYPTDNLRIGACQQFEIDLSNKYDLDPRNLAKLELWSLEGIAGSSSQGEDCALSFAPECWQPTDRIAGGRDCSEDALAVEAGAVPCLTVDVTNQRTGGIGVEIDAVRFKAKLSHAVDGKSGRYRFLVPGLDHVASFAELDLDDPEDLAAYDAAFHDVCGMPLIAGGGQGYTDSLYDFSVDPPKCKEDLDEDGVPFSCDNADDYPNADQSDQDYDHFGDVEDLCVLTPTLSNTGDADSDGVGNECDVCRKQPSYYNDMGAGLPLDARYWVRAGNSQADSDRDGIGDLCDNCVAMANCGIFGVDLVPHEVGVPVPDGQPGVCQQDVDANLIGDACADQDNPDAAGPVGLTNTDDFDQDGLINAEDLCPRQPIERLVCTSDDECGANRACATTPAHDGLRYCNHLDSDDDTVGDVCDSCRYVANPMQTMDGGAQADDLDDDGVGNVCETATACKDRSDPAPLGFFAVAVDGLCCTSEYPGDGAYVLNDDGSWGCEGRCDPDGFPIMANCADEANPNKDLPDGSKCRPLPEAVLSREGVAILPPGCEVALAQAGLCDPQDPDCPVDQANRRLTLADVPDPDTLWGMMCSLPQWDQDFDGLGDACDLCPYRFDPTNAIYIDPVTKKEYANRGRYCNGDYSPDATCDMAPGEDETDTGETSSGSESG